MHLRLLHKKIQAGSSSKNTRGMAGIRNMDMNSIFQDDPLLRANFSFAIQQGTPCLIPNSRDKLCNSAEQHLSSLIMMPCTFKIYTN